MSIIRLLLEILEQGIDINITIRMSPPKATEEYSLNCPHCDFVTRGHKTRKSAERALRSHANHCIKRPEFADIVQFVEQMDEQT